MGNALAAMATAYADALEVATGVRPVAEDPDDPFQLAICDSTACDNCRGRGGDKWGRTVVALVYDNNADDLRPLCWVCVRNLGLL